MQVVESLFKKTGHKIEVVLETDSIEKAHGFEAKKAAIDYAQGRGCNTPAINGGPSTWWVNSKGEDIKDLSTNDKLVRVLWPLEERVI